jgi:hypothetical protein
MNSNPAQIVKVVTQDKRNNWRIVGTCKWPHPVTKGTAVLKCHGGKLPKYFRNGVPAELRDYKVIWVDIDYQEVPYIKLREGDDPTHLPHWEEL